MQLVLATASVAVTIDSGNGSGNTSAPADDPGWANVGFRSDQYTSRVYLGDRWVLTASHVGAHPITLSGVEYARAEPLESYLVGNGDGTYADLLLYRLRDLPPLPS